MSFIMVRACHGCKEYVRIDPVDPTNQELIKIFENNHLGHMVISISISEVEDYYENVEDKLTSL